MLELAAIMIGSGEGMGRIGSASTLVGEWVYAKERMHFKMYLIN